MFTYDHRSPFTYRNPVNAQEPKETNKNLISETNRNLILEIVRLHLHMITDHRLLIQTGGPQVHTIIGLRLHMPDKVEHLIPIRIEVHLHMQDKVEHHRHMIIGLRLPMQDRGELLNLDGMVM